jgi:hypothetical protein
MTWQIHHKQRNAHVKLSVAQRSTKPANPVFAHFCALSKKRLLLAIKPQQLQLFALHSQN